MYCKWHSDLSDRCLFLGVSCQELERILPYCKHLGSGKNQGASCEEKQFHKKKETGSYRNEVGKKQGQFTEGSVDIRSFAELLQRATRRADAEADIFRGILDERFLVVFGFFEVV